MHLLTHIKKLMEHGKSILNGAKRQAPAVIEDSATAPATTTTAEA